MPSNLVLHDTAGRPERRVVLTRHDEEVLAPVLSQLAPYATDPRSAAVTHVRADVVLAAWTAAGALRMAALLPPAYTRLAAAIREVAAPPPAA